MQTTNAPKQLNNDIKIGLKSFISICAILLGIMILVGILTFIIPSGSYQYDANGEIIPDSFALHESTSRLPILRWFTAPVEALLWGQGNFNIIQIILVLLVLGGSFKVLDKTGGLYAIVQIIINKFYNHRYSLIWIITLFMMLLAALFGLQEELLIMFPIFISFSKAMNWSNTFAASLVLTTTGVGFTTAIFNPFTIGVASELAGTNMLDGIWYRIIIFVIMYFLTSLFLVFTAKREEKKNVKLVADSDFEELSAEEKADYNRRARAVIGLFVLVLAVILVASIIPAIADLGLGMVFMAATFVIGSLVIGKKCLGKFSDTIKSFLLGAKDIAPSIVIILLAFSVKYIADNGEILHTMFYYCHNFMCQQSPYVSVILLYLLILVLEFFIPGASAKALLLIPLLTIAPIPYISTNIIILAFLFGDGYANVLFPTCGTLVVGLGLAEVSYVEWLKKTIGFQILSFILSIVFLLLAVYIGL